MTVLGAQERLHLIVLTMSVRPDELPLARRKPLLSKKLGITPPRRRLVSLLKVDSMKLDHAV